MAHEEEDCLGIGLDDSEIQILLGLLKLRCVVEILEFLVSGAHHEFSVSISIDPTSVHVVCGQSEGVATSKDHLMSLEEVFRDDNLVLGGPWILSLHGFGLLLNYQNRFIIHIVIVHIQSGPRELRGMVHEEIPVSSQILCIVDLLIDLTFIFILKVITRGPN